MEIDTLSIILLLLIILFTILSIKDVPNPDVHPLILTSQADVARIRHPGETAIYRSNLALHGMALLSNPEKSVKTIADLFKAGASQGDKFLGVRGPDSLYTWVCIDFNFSS